MPELTIQQAMEIAVGHHRAGRLADAENIYRQILQAQPNHPDALHLLGVIANQTRQFELGRQLIAKAIAASPRQAPFFFNLGISLKELGRFDEAVSAFRESIALNPDDPETHHVLAQTLFLANRLDDAMAVYENASRRFPSDATFPYNHAVILTLRGELKPAAELYLRSLSINPRFTEAIMNLAVALHRLGEIDEALERYDQALALAPDRAETLANRGELLKEIGRLDEALRDNSRALELKPDSILAADNLILLMLYLPDISPQKNNAYLKLWNDRFAVPLRNRRTPLNRIRDPNKKLKIGFVSADFRVHPVGRFILPLLNKLDRSRLQIHCYNDTRVHDSINQLCRESADVWRNTAGLSHPQLAQRVREDEIDILVDLANHMAAIRLIAFAEKPAPILASWLAYCASTGLETMDYRLADPYLEPPGNPPDEPERIYRLPKTYWCYPEPTESPDPAEPPSIQSGQITFGCLNNFCKFNASVLELWAQILHRLPESRLILYIPQGQCRDRLKADLNRFGISENRIFPVGKMSMSGYFSKYGQVDVALDPFPFNGGTTTCDALWMGVPVVSLVGARAISRAGLSILTNAGFGQWAAHDPAEYVNIAVELAQNESARRQLRESTRKTMKSSPLMDIDAFANDMAMAFAEFWRTWISSGGWG